VTAETERTKSAYDDGAKNLFQYALHCCRAFRKLDEHYASWKIRAKSAEATVRLVQKGPETSRPTTLLKPSGYG
jgi:hypothetical protein